MTFAGCTSLKTITFEEGLTSIGAQAFKNCLSLTDFTLPSTLKEICSQAFMNCASFKHTLRLPNTTERIGRDAFKGTHVTISIPSSRPENSLRIAPEDMQWFDDNVKIVSEGFKKPGAEMNEQLPRDLAQAYKTNHSRKDSAQGHDLLHSREMDARRGSHIDFYNSDYEVVDAATAVQRCREHPQDVTKLRVLFGSAPQTTFLELDLRNNGKPYPIVLPGDASFAQAMVEIGAPNYSKVADWVRHKVQSWAGLQQVLARASKIYWTDEYEHLVSSDDDSEITARRGENTQVYQTMLRPLTPKNPQRNTTSIRVPDTGDHKY